MLNFKLERISLWLVALSIEKEILMFGGNVYKVNCDDWEISWESLDGHRFWCGQAHPSNSRTAAVVMLNPGSLAGDGRNLGKDTTLRILRGIFLETKYNPFVINLFSLATPRPKDLFVKWEVRDHPIFSYESFSAQKFSAVLYAYGDYENGGQYSDEIKQRITRVRDFFCGVPEIIVPVNKSGTPKHPLPIQRQRLKDCFRQAIVKHATADNRS